MRSLHEAGEAVKTYSPAEELFNRRRRNVGLIGGPIALLVLLAAPLPIAPPAHRLGAILLMMVILWITEALPLAVTALIGPVLAIILQVAPARAVFAPFADPIIFLFIGSFMLAEAMFAAIVYSSGHVPITAMMRHGIALDIAGFILIVLVVMGLGWVI